MTKMKTIPVLLVALVALSSLGIRAAEPTADEIVERYIKARGGAQAWSKVKTLRSEGDYTAFSDTHPFEELRMYPNMMRFDSKFTGQEWAFGYDGNVAWWVMPFSVDWATPSPPAEVTVTLGQADLGSALFEYRKAGHQIEALGMGDLDGVEGYRLQVTRSDGAVETWYFDPETYLEVAREAPGSDFGQPMPQRIYFDDYREVEGLTFPFYVEWEWGTRHRIVDISKIEINPELDAKVFEMPPPRGSEPLHPMVGEWNVKVEYRDSPQGEFKEAATQSTIVGAMQNTLLQEHISFLNEEGRPQEEIRTYSFDRFRDAFQVTYFDRFTRYNRALHGQFSDGKLVVNTVEGKQGWTGFGQEMHDQISLTTPTESGFVVEVSNSFDGGANFVPMTRYTYSRP